jgi:hypothetical protein
MKEKEKKINIKNIVKITKVKLKERPISKKSKTTYTKPKRKVENVIEEENKFFRGISRMRKEICFSVEKDYGGENE